ncbi:MAG TPA: FAD-dependent oxidoreductase [Myxococcota bacterium]|nr:FAD-dependent oxidoreductase [Myxococcota bacterium]
MADLVVLGSGGAGLTAALVARAAGLSVALYEKSDRVGGTTAWSGGMIWIPNNHHMRAAGIPDSTEEAVGYLLSMSHGLMEESLVRAFVETGPEMVRWLEASSPVQFQSVGAFPDYHPEHPGGKPRGGRSLECPMFSYKELGDWAARVDAGDFYDEVITTMGETPLGQPLPKSISEAELARRRANDERGRGLALIGRLLKACLDRGVEVHTGARAALLVQERGAVSGVRFESGAEVSARAGVVLATGGFEWNDRLVAAFLRGPMNGRVSPRTNTGDGLVMAMKAGAALANMREAWWLPVAEVPSAGGGTRAVLITCERTFPGSIMVNREARRFTNEAANYNAFGAAFHEMDVSRFDYRNLPCWLIFDHAYYEKYGFGWDAAPGKPAPVWLTCAPSLAALAKELGISDHALAETVARWNAMVEAGRDADFARGESANDTWWGDPSKKLTREATLGKLAKAPFYAVEVKSGCLGTKGGPRVDRHARVLDHAGSPIPGLYAAGNVMGSPMGMTYGGAGGTIAPGMVFGFLAAKHAATRVMR